MKTSKLTQGSRSIGYYTGTFSALALFLSIGISSQAHAFTQISQQLDLGQTNGDVTSLQEFLAASPELYPQGLITGYYGALTREAVEKFQGQYGLAKVGRVGPLTLAKINSLIGGGSGVANATGPVVFMQYAPQTTSTSATFNWATTNEVASGRLYYSTSPLQMNEGNINSNGFAVTSGQLASYDGIARQAQSAIIAGLQPNTTYYYTIVATDANGNVSVVGPNNTFRTNSQ